MGPKFHLDPDLWVTPERGGCPLDSPQKGDNVSPKKKKEEEKEFVAFPPGEEDFFYKVHHWY